MLLRALQQREARGGAPAAAACSLPARLQRDCAGCFATRARFAVLASTPGCVTALELEPARARVLLATDTRATVRLLDGEARGAAGAGAGAPGGAARACRAPLASYFSAAAAHSRAVTSCAWYPRDGGLFVTGGADGLCVVWDPGLAGGAGARLAPVYRVAVGSASGGGAAAAAPAAPSSAGAGAGAGAAAAGRVHCVAMSPCASAHALVACGTDSPLVRLLDLASGVAVHALPGHRDGVYACAWAPLHEHLLASGSRDGALLLHDVRRSGRLALLAAGDASAEERAWLAACAPGAAGRVAGLRLPAPTRESLGLAFRGATLGTDTAVHGNPGGDVPSLAARAHGAGGVNGLLWLPPAARAGGGGSGSGSGDGGGAAAAAQGALMSTGADGCARQWGVALVAEGGGGAAEAERDAGNLVDGRPGGAALWNSLKEFAGVGNRAKRCLRLAASSGGLLFHPFASARASSASASASGGGGGGSAAAAAAAAAGEAAAQKGAIGVWDLGSGARVGQLSGGHMENVNAVCWGEGGGGTLFSGGDDGLVLRWRAPHDAAAALEEETEEEGGEEEEEEEVA